MLLWRGMSTSLRMVLGALTVGACSFAFACSMSSETASFDGRNDGTANPSPGEGSSGSLGASDAGAPSDLVPTDNAVILVHAARVQPFRLCFGDQRDLQPQPDTQAMPQANVVGVEVGNAVRIKSLAPGAPGKVYLFEEPLIRSLYFNPDPGSGAPSCKKLIEAPTTAALAIDLGEVKDDLSKGVHLLVVKGCPRDAIIKYSAAECGAGWTPEKGNLAVEKITLTGAYRNDPKKLPTQVVNLSAALETAREGRQLTISFGKLATVGKLGTTVSENPGLFKTSSPVSVDFDPDNLATFDDSGFRVQVAAGNGKPAIEVDDSLAQIQKASAPRDIPSSYYSVASNYVLLMLGDPNAKLEDGGPDTNPRNLLHFLAVPVVENTDGGAPDASPDAP